MTIPVEKITKVVSHANCPDGIASAMIVRDALPSVPIEFMQYNTPEHENMVVQEGLTFVDFSPHHSRYQEFIDGGAFCLDHHKGAKDVVAAFGERGVYADEKEEPGVSGAVLAFRHIWQPSVYRIKRLGKMVGEQEVSRFAELAGIRDTWQTKSPDWFLAKKQAQTLMRLPRDFWMSIDLAEAIDLLNGTLPAFIDDDWNESILRKVREAWRTKSEKGTKVVLFEGTRSSSDAAELIDKDADLVVGFNMFVEGGERKIIYSTRSHTGFDCKALAKMFPGGGGHTAAAGFNTLVNHEGKNPYDMFIEILDMFEGGWVLPKD